MNAMHLACILHPAIDHTTSQRIELQVLEASIWTFNIQVLWNFFVPELTSDMRDITQRISQARKLQYSTP
jgi:hypothetical protein